ncbi:MAG: fumarylacetoacetate hydrolase family protein [Parvibaculaceae bacterium]
MRARSLGLLALALSVWLSAPALAQVTEGDDAPLRFGRFEHQGEAHYGVLASGGVHQLTKSFLEPDVVVTGTVFKLEEVKLLAPIVPSKVIAVARNYKGHGGAKKAELEFFAKLPSSLTGLDAGIVPPPGSKDLHFEGEMAIVMAARTRNVTVEKAKDSIFGVTAANDVTERSYPFEPFDLLRAKAFDTSGPLGPWIVPGLSYDRLKLTTRLNGKVVQQASTSEMLWKTAEIVAAVSRYITLEPGDVILTGTPGETTAMKPGDIVEVELEGVGVLRNKVEASAEDAPKP